jgi:4a-hydroxytetrahydrobiopterin dehydratase
MRGLKRSMTMRVQLHTGEGVSREQAHAARERIAALDGYTHPEPTDGRLALRRSESPGERPFLAEASVLVDGRLLAARATGDTVLDAAAKVADRLGRRLRRLAREARVAVPGEWLSWARAARRGWDWRGDTLVRELTFRDFDEGMRFLDQVARRAEDYKRHPDMSISANHVRLRIANPHQAGITLAELRLAAKVNAVVDEFGGVAGEVS